MSAELRMSYPGHDFSKFSVFLHHVDSSQQISRGEPEFKSNYNPSEYVITEEAMIPFKDRLGFKQCIKDKPFSDAINGYVYRF